MRVLAIGDIVGKNGVDFLRSKINNLKQEKNIDFVIANGENSAEGNGITPESASKIFGAGVDVITGGNHSFRRKEIFSYMKTNRRLLRPYNFPAKTTPGFGYCKTQVNNINIAVINIMGVSYLESLKCPFESLEEAVNLCRECPVKIVDIHAETTAEKLALSYYIDGKVSAIFGTHTHVQTSDETIKTNGTGYITDVGMTGSIESVLGVKKELSIKRLKDKLPVRFENADGLCKLECVIFDINPETTRTEYIERLRII